MKLIRDIVNKITNIMLWVGILSCIVLTGLITVDVGGRRFFNHPLAGNYEYVQIFFSIIAFTAIVAAQQKGSHIQITLVLRILPQTLRFIVLGLCNLVSTVTSGVLCYAMFRHGLRLLGTGESTQILNFPLYPLAFLFSLFLLLFTVQLLLESIRTLSAIKDEKLAKEIMDAWN